jgi:hypothetical protein
MVRGHRLPNNSEAGAHNNGPEANPRTYSVVPSIPTSVLTLNSSLAPEIPVAKMALEKVAVKVPKQAMNET